MFKSLVTSVTRLSGRLSHLVLKHGDVSERLEAIGFRG